VPATTRARFGTVGRRLATASLGVLVGLAAALLASGRAAAQEAAATPTIGGGVSGYGVGDWVDLVVRLGLVLLIIWAAIMAMRWWVRRMNGGFAGGNGRLVQILETRSLGPNRSLQLVKLGNRAVLLGVTNERISPVLELTDPVEIQRLTRTVEQQQPETLRDAISRLGSLARRRPSVGPERSTTTTRDPRAAMPLLAARQAASAAAPAPGRPKRGRWATIARRVIGLEDPPLRRVAQRPTAARAAAPPARPAPARGPADSPAMRALAAELPASRAVRARSGYRQSQIAEAQRAIASVRGELPR
jgi:flagellar protein FliO/FliZ